MGRAFEGIWLELSSKDRPLASLYIERAKYTD